MGRVGVRTIAAIAAVALAAYACGDDELFRNPQQAARFVPSHAAPPPVPPPPPPGPGDAGPAKAAFGLDARAPNPTCRAGPRPSGGNDVELVDAFPNVLGYWGLDEALQAPGDPS